MLEVFYSVDTEVWCDGWHNLDARFPSAFDSHIHGRTALGDFGLPLQAQSIVGVEIMPGAPRAWLNKPPAPASRHASGKRNSTRLRGWGIADLS